MNVWVHLASGGSPAMATASSAAADPTNRTLQLRQANAIWINLAITRGAMVILAALELRLRIPRQAPIVIAKIMLGFTVAATAWTAVVVPMLPV